MACAPFSGNLEAAVDRDASAAAHDNAIKEGNVRMAQPGDGMHNACDIRTAELLLCNLNHATLAANMSPSRDACSPYSVRKKPTASCCLPARADRTAPLTSPPAQKACGAARQTLCKCSIYKGYIISSVLHLVNARKPAEPWGQRRAAGCSARCLRRPTPGSTARAVAPAQHMQAFSPPI
jgi:hypothetical protein